MGFFLAYDSRMHCVSLIRNFKLKMYIFESRITVCLCYRKNHNNVLFFFRSWAHAINRPTRLILRPLIWHVPFQFSNSLRPYVTSTLCGLLVLKKGFNNERHDLRIRLKFC